MKTYESIFKFMFASTLPFLFLLLPSCADRDAPTPEIAQKLLTAFFEGQGFKVVSIDLGRIEGESVTQKKYGKKRLFYVTVKRVVLEGQGRQIAREKGVVTIMEKIGAANEWVIEQMPPELAP